MEDQISKLVETVSRQSQRIDELEARVNGLEARLSNTPISGASEQRALRRDAAPRVDTASVVPVANPWLVGLPALIGRTIMVLGGAFFLRALTESGAMPPGAGVGLGLTYALAWIGMADRAARAGRAPDATAHGLATTLIAFPLIWEASTRFGLVGPPLSALILTAVAGAILGIAWLRCLGLLAWIVTLASTMTGVALLFATRSLPLFSGALFTLAVVSLAASFHRQWYGLRWPAAIALDILAVLAMFLVGRTNYEWLQPNELASVQLLITAGYLGVIGVRTVVLGHPTRDFGIVQSLLVLTVGFEGARRTLGAEHIYAGAFGPFALGLAVSCYIAAFARFEKDPRQRTNWTWYLTLGTILAIYSAPLLVPGHAVGLVWAVLAFTGAYLGRREERVAVRWNTMALAVASAFGSGLLGASYLAFFGADPAEWLVFPLSAWGAAIFCLAAWVLSRWVREVAEDAPDHTLPGCALLLVGAMGSGGGLVCLLGPWVSEAGTSAADPGSLAVLRTAVLIAFLLVIAGMSRVRRHPELVWTAYGALAATACKIAVDDLPNGRAITMFLSFILFGGAMILAPRMVPEADTKGSNTSNTRWSTKEGEDRG